MKQLAISAPAQLYVVHQEPAVGSTTDTLAPGVRALPGVRFLRACDPSCTDVASQPNDVLCYLGAGRRRSAADGSASKAYFGGETAPVADSAARCGSRADPWQTGHSTRVRSPRSRD